MKYNWVKVAVDHPGGAQAVAERFGFKSRQTVYIWMEKQSIAHLPLEQAAEFSRVSGINLVALSGIADLPDLMPKARRVRKMRDGRAGGKPNATESEKRKPSGSRGSQPD